MNNNISETNINNRKCETSRFQKWSSRLVSFVVGQGSVQLLNLISGFLLVRWLTVKDYAAYSLVTGFQGSIGVLVELGLGSSIVALAAGRTDPQVIGTYICSTRHYRNRFFFALLPVVMVVFPILTLRQGWSVPLTAVLLGAILTTLYFQSWATYYSVPLLIYQKLVLYYRTPTILGVVRLVSSLCLYFLTLLSSVTAVWISSLSTVAQGWLYKRHSANLIIEPLTCSPEANKEVLGFIRPLMPSTIFFALQGQISILLITWYGKTGSIAEVGALGRIGQLFVMLGAFNGVVVAPYIASVAKHKLLLRYLQVLAGAMGISVILAVFTAISPNFLLWILGEKYNHLKSELFWMMASACIAYLTGVMWTMHSARKWIYSWGVWAYISAVIVVQIFGLVFMNLGTTKNVITLSLYSALVSFLVQVAWGVVGFNKQYKTIAS